VWSRRVHRLQPQTCYYGGHCPWSAVTSWIQSELVWRKRIVCLSSFGSSGFPYTPLLLLLQSLAQATASVPGPWEELMWVREFDVTTEAFHATIVRATEASA
jgi:hypothetical protein